MTPPPSPTEAIRAAADPRAHDDVERPHTPAQAWAELAAGNARFVAGTPEHPNQDAARRVERAGGQKPFACFFGCSDSRVAAEVIFDRGLGDLFVVRTAGHVVDSTALGSLEFAAEVLQVPLIVVLGHDSCGAIGASIRAFEDGVMPSGFLRDLVERVTPSVTAAYRGDRTDPDEVGREHVRQTVDLVQERSRALAARIADGRLAIVGLTYTLLDGRAGVVAESGELDPQG